MTSASPALFKSLTSGSTYSRAIVTQRETDGTVIGTWTLSSLGVVDQDIVGQDDALPGLNLSFSFGVLGSQTSSADIRWDVVNNRPSVDPTATNVTNIAQTNARTLASTTAISSTTAVASTPLLTLELAGGTARPVSLNLNSFNLGTHSNGSFGANGYSSVIPSFEPLIVSSALSTDTPFLYEALVTAKYYASGTLVQRDSLGSPIAVWALDKVFVSDAIFSGSGDASNQQEMTFRFASMTEATSASPRLGRN